MLTQRETCSADYVRLRNDEPHVLQVRMRCLYLHCDICPFTEVVEHACSVTSLMLGETLPSLTKDMDTYTFRLPLGVCAGIAPFNFPAMIPLWMFPMGMVCGNTYLMKPSERVPGATMLLARLLQDAGAPDGTLNIIHGQHAGKGALRWTSSRYDMSSAQHGPALCPRGHGESGARGKVRQWKLFPLPPHERSCCRILIILFLSFQL